MEHWFKDTSNLNEVHCALITLTWEQKKGKQRHLLACGGGFGFILFLIEKKSLKQRYTNPAVWPSPLLSHLLCRAVLVCKNPFRQAKVMPCWWGITRLASHPVVFRGPVFYLLRNICPLSPVIARVVFVYVRWLPHTTHHGDLLTCVHTTYFELFFTFSFSEFYTLIEKDLLTTNFLCSARLSAISQQICASNLLVHKKCVLSHLRHFCKPLVNMFLKVRLLNRCTRQSSWCEQHELMFSWFS